MQVRLTPTQLQPPTLADARVVGEPASGRVLVEVAHAVAFSFDREGDGGDWEGGDALTSGRGLPVAEEWLSVARHVAAEALRRVLTADSPDGAGDTVRCEECDRLLCSPVLSGAGSVKKLYCGPEHTVLFESGRCFVLAADGTHREVR